MVKYSDDYEKNLGYGAKKTGVVSLQIGQRARPEYSSDGSPVSQER
jgi:hypothetical protein